MERASRLIPRLSRSCFCADPTPFLRLARPIPQTSHAGPSTLTTCRRFVTIHDVHASAPYETSRPPANAAEEVLDEEEVPGNVSFEEIEEAEEQVSEALAQGGPRLHASAVLSTEPIILPLSHLGAENPSIAGPSGLAIALPPDVFTQQLRRDILHRCVIWYRSTMRQGTKKTLSRSEVSYSGRKLHQQKGSGRARVGDASSPIRRGGAMAHAIRPRDWAQDLPRKVRALGMRIALSSKLQMGLLRVVEDLNEGKWTKTGQASQALSDGWVQRGIVQQGEMSTAAEISADVADESVAEHMPGPENPPPLEDQPELSASPPDGAEATEEQMSPAENESYEYITRFGPSRELSILFLHPPEKPAESLWPFARVIRNIPGVEIMSTDEVEVYYILKFKWLVMEGGAVDAIIRQKGHPSVTEVGLEVGEESDTSKLASEGRNELDEERKAPMPKSWELRKWRHDTGAKSMRKVFGMNNATRMEKEAKKAKKAQKRLSLVKLA